MSLRPLAVVLMMGVACSTTRTHRVPTAPPDPEALACGTPKACFEAAMQLEASGDFTGARKRFEQACDQKMGPACGRLAFYYREGKGVTADPDMERMLLERGCESNDAFACATLGAYTEYGRGVPVDLARAKQLYEQACRRSPPRNCSYLGELYEKGKGVPKSFEQARRIFEFGDEGGDANSSASLAGYYLYGQGGLRPDPQKAYAMAQAACASGGHRGCTIQGLVLEKSDDLDGAFQLYDRACTFGDQLGCTFLGTMFATGSGTAVDLVKASALWRQSCQNGVQQACLQLKKLEALTEPEPAPR